jgi:hypothetical protein
MIFPHRPCDPRSRSVVSHRQSGRDFALTLSCGHVVKRRMMCAPSSVICGHCPAVGGMGGNRFDDHRRAG